MNPAEQSELHGYREQQLLRLMRRLSEALYSDSWHMGLERILFRYAFMQDPVGVTFMPMDSLQIRRLAKDTQCWWHWPEGAECEQKISLDEARRLYG